MDLPIDTPIGRVVAIYRHYPQLFARTDILWRRKVGPFMVRTFVDRDGRSIGSIWVKEDFQ